MEAGRLKRELREELGIKPKMSFAGIGVLEVLVDGRRVFSVQEARRNPRPGEIAELVRAQTSG